MQQEKNIRQLVLEMLLAVTKKEGGEYSHKVIRDVQNKYNYLSTQEKAFMKRLFEGTLERMIELDYCIDCYSKVKVNKMKPVIRNIMRMGVYQILYMDSVPDSAACNESVKQAQAKGFATLKGFVNGVLRTIARNKDAIPYPDEKYLVIQSTSVGLYPHVEDAVITDPAFYHKVKAGYDLIYRPWETRFMQLVKEQGAPAYNGLKMLLYQGIEAFELWNQCKIEDESAYKLYEMLRTTV